jgi:hypothetical protein
MAAQRIKRLKDLVDRLERLPESPDRDRLLSEVRSRTVDVDTGVAPRAMLPMREPVPPLVLPRPPKPYRVSSNSGTAPATAPALALARSAFSADLDQSLCVDERLSLEDSPLPHVRAQGDRAVRPWTLGLRG